MPNFAASSLPKVSDSLEETRSGRKMPCTFSGPKARTARAVQSAESMPPEMPTTRPLRRWLTVTSSRIRLAMRSASAVMSAMRRTSLEKLMAEVVS
jgi:hypothetical protein